MRNSIALLVFCSLFALSGCSKGTDAASRSPRPRGAASRSGADSGLPEFVATEGGSASSVPGGGSKLLEKVEVVIENVEEPNRPVGTGPTLLGSTALEVKVAVTNRHTQLRLLIEPQRFWLEADGLQRITSRAGGTKDPPLGRGYLKSGETVSGWLLFDVPAGAKDLLLKSNLRRPDVQIPLPAPGYKRP